ncbi:hypothetical protein LUD75_03425 [Epilithonimonas sp. JDS]|uniref:hypothetical protein n=1 Tax=Epilithonimonas sp. JDS TaxID=2902797 RepID=UPI001E5E6AF4|nr:hypothetical protein [Epilithonimonas sp. JDS]MCD9853737.1 hypothetical protein [Epilithonimonas sp. JDS]
MKQNTYSTKKIADELGLSETELIEKLQQEKILDDYGFPTPQAIELGYVVKLDDLNFTVKKIQEQQRKISNDALAIIQTFPPVEIDYILSHLQCKQ